MARESWFINWKMSTPTPTTTQDTELLDCIRRIGNELPLEPAQFDLFNKVVLNIIGIATPALAVQLAQLMLDVNKRIYEARRPNEHTGH